MSFWPEIRNKLSFYFKALLLIIMSGVIFVFSIFSYYNRDLPDYHQLEAYNPPLVSRAYAANGKLIQEYAKEKRIYVKYENIPQTIIAAFLAAEDKNFFNHQGLDYLGIIRAAAQNILNLGQKKGLSGGSTITQQVVKNFLLTNERSLARKVKEAILAFRISRTYSKEKVLELYLNQIFLGQNSYGIVAASLNYFNKDIVELTVAEAALLAAMPKAPSAVNPLKNKERAVFRRNWVVERMLENGFITQKQAEEAIKTPLVITKRWEVNFVNDADFYAESVRMDMLKTLGNDNLYTKGYSIFTYMDEAMQKAASQSLRNGLLKYDREHGYRGPVARINLGNNWQEAFNKWDAQPYTDEYKLAVVIKVSHTQAEIGFKDGRSGVIPLASLKWARKAKANAIIGPEIKEASAVLNIGDVVLVSNIKNNEYLLEQVPEVEGAIIVMQVGTGKVLALSGGYRFAKNKFNRVLQAGRQPGSAFKPLVYLAALENGYTPTTIVSDSPACFSQGAGMPLWCPKNYSNDYLGDITVRKALEKSRNIPVVKIATDVGLDKIAEISSRLDVFSSPPKTLAVALGAYETTLMRLTNAYNIIASGGKKIIPQFIDQVIDIEGKVIEKNKYIDLQITNQLPEITYRTNQIIDVAKNYQLSSILEGVVIRGTAARAAQLNWPIAGKTGTTNESFDTWFIGYTPDIVVGIYVGYDQPKTLGKKVTGATLPLPIFIEFMKKTIPNMPKTQFIIPEELTAVTVYADSGEIVDSNNSGKNTVKELIHKEDKNQLSTNNVVNQKNSKDSNLNGIY